MNRVERRPSRFKSYLWVVGAGTESLPMDELVADRYRVVGPRIWLDTKPDQCPEAAEALPTVAHPYLRSHPHRLHLPGLYGVLDLGVTSILLIDNAPIHPQAGELLPELEAAIPSATPLRQANWLWQTWDLWETLGSLGLGRSLFLPGNLRVDGWRLRLLELEPDAAPPTLAELADLWRSLLSPLHRDVSEPLRLLVNRLDANDLDPMALSVELNQIVLSQAATVPTRLALSGAVAQGPTQPRNEDACWPLGTQADSASPTDLQVAIVCDGVGGHEGGALASQLAVQSLQIQLQALVAEAQAERQVLPPAVIIQQLESVIRIVNELINFQNDNQSRVGRQRMGTTLALAVVIPQSVKLEVGWGRVNEVYLAHVGDSRAYWITPDYCHLLTVDDDIAGREVAACRQTWPLAQERSDAGALTQAIGTRGGDHLSPHIQRFIFDETGLLLLCTDGLSDNYRIEDAWANYIGLIIKDIVPLESAVASWVELANQKNGHDNTAVVLMLHRLLVQPQAPAAAAARGTQGVYEPEPPVGATLYGESLPQEDPVPVTAAKPPAGVPRWLLAVSGSVLLVLLGWWLVASRSPTPNDPPPPPPTAPSP